MPGFRPRSPFFTGVLSLILFALTAPASAAPKVGGFLRSAQRAKKSGGLRPQDSAPAGDAQVDREALRRMSGHISVDPDAADPWIGLLIQVTPGTSRAQLQAVSPDLRLFTRAGDIFTAKLPVRLLGLMETPAFIIKVSASEKLRQLNDRARSSYSNGGVYVGVNAPSSGNTGSGAIVGIVDTGIDFRHPDFLDAANQSRILWLRDEVSDAAWSQAMINTQLQDSACRTNLNNCTTITLRDTEGHGTHVAGSAAGDDDIWKGIAYEADLIIVKADTNGSFGSGDVIDAVGSVFGLAAAEGKPAVVNLSVGGWAGPHDGTGLFPTSLAALTGAGKIIVAAAGNDRNLGLHGQGSGDHTYTLSVDANSSFTWVDLWYPGSDSYSVQLCVNAACGTALTPGDSESTTLSGVAVDVDHYGNDPSNGDKEVQVIFNSGINTGNSITIQFTGGTSQVHGWCDGSLSFSSPVNTHLISIPAVSASLIAVGGYSNKNSWVITGGGSGSYSTPITEGYLYDAGAYGGSSPGPTRDGRTKPDISAPGWGIGSAMSYVDSGVQSWQILEGNPYGHRINQGTSMASPIVAGIVALHLEQDPTLTPAEVLTILRNGARSDAATGSVPNNDFGWGKVDGALGLSGTAPVLSSSLSTPDSKSITWSWTINTSNHTEIRVHRVSDDADLSGQLATSAVSWTQQPLTPDTQYSVYVKVSNATGSLSSNSVTKRTLAAPPLSNSPSGIGSTAITANWGANDNPGTVRYFVQKADDAGFTANVADSGWIAATSHQFTGLTIASEYHFRVKARNSDSTETAYVTLPSTYTTMSPPTTLPLSGITVNSITANWGDGGNPGSVEFWAERALDSGFTQSAEGSGWQSATTYDFSGLIHATTYYFRVKARRTDGIQSAWIDLSSAATLAAAPVSDGISGITDTQAVASWTANSNPAGTFYNAEKAEDNGYSLNYASSGWTSATNWTFSGLTPNTTHYFRVRAKNPSQVESATTALPEAVTLAHAPSEGTHSEIRISSLTFGWNANGNPGHTRYLADLSPTSDFSASVVSSETVATSWTAGGLQPNTTYYLRLRAVSHDGNSTASITLSTSTLANPPTPAAEPLSGVIFTVTARWTPSASASGYRVEVAEDGGFTSNRRLFDTQDPGASSMEVTGLDGNTTYYFRVGAFNWDRLITYPPHDNYLSLGSTLTSVFNRSSDSVSGYEKVILAMTPPFSTVVEYIEVEAPPGSLPSGTELSMIASPGFVYQTQYSNQATLTPLAADIAADISAGGAQPGLPVTVRMRYAAAAIPGGKNPRHLVIANYRDEFGQWTLLPTRVDAANRVLTAQTLHFSIFAPFFVSLGSALDSVQIYPIPWMPGTNDPQFDHPKLTVTNLPADGNIRIYTILGELVHELKADGNPIIYWDGRNDHGEPAGSGTYLAVITGGGARKVRRLVVIR